MSSRLMLSLKKTTVQLEKPWSLSTLTTISMGRSTDGGTSYSTQGVHEGSHEIPPTPPVRNEEDIELNAVPPLPQDRDSHHAR